eukprot:scaffold320952_cov30-Tisochrysis_lutea.AAC.3
MQMFSCSGSCDAESSTSSKSRSPFAARSCSRPESLEVSADSVWVALAFVRESTDRTTERSASKRS